MFAYTEKIQNKERKNDIPTQANVPFLFKQTAPMDIGAADSRISLMKNETVNSTGIPNMIKERFEKLSGFSFNDVKVHYNSEKPVQLQALAYTQGSHVHIGPGQEKHLEHELVHVVQQKQGRVPDNPSINNDRTLEYEADNKIILVGSKPVQRYSEAIQRVIYPDSNTLVTAFKNLFAAALIPAEENAAASQLGAPDKIGSKLTQEANQVIPGVDITVEIAPTGGNTGLTIYNDTPAQKACTIRIDPGLSYPFSMTVFLHELTHLLAHYSYISNANLQIGSQEFTTNPDGTPVAAADRQNVASQAIRAWTVGTRNMVNALPQPATYLNTRLDNIHNSPLTERDATLSDMLAFLTINTYKLNQLYNHIETSYDFTVLKRQQDRQAQLAPLNVQP